MSGNMLWREQEHEPLTDQEWDPELARAAIRAIVADAEAAERDGGWPGHPLDDVPEDELLCSLYLGGAGMVWALARLGSSIDGSAAVATSLERYRASPGLRGSGAPAEPARRRDGRACRR